MISTGKIHPTFSTNVTCTNLFPTLFRNRSPKRATPRSLRVPGDLPKEIPLKE